VKVAWFDAEDWEKEYLESNYDKKEYEFFDQPLNKDTVEKVEGCDAVTVFVSSEVDSSVIEQLDVEMICCRSTGFDHVDLDAAEEQGIAVYNVPAYGATTVAEHTFGLILSLSRQIYSAIRKVENGSFSHAGLRGFDLERKTLGVIGTGAIGREVIRIANGFNMETVAYDPYPNQEAAEELGYSYVSLEELLEQADVITLHCPLTDDNHHLISKEEFEQMDGAVIVNTARGELIDTEALLKALEKGSVKSAGLDVLEDECYVEEDLEVTELEDECDLRTVLADHRLIDRDDVIVTPHNAFNSQEAMKRIVDTTADNLDNRSNPVD
jgi:D-lactate dehydrogenase